MFHTLNQNHHYTPTPTTHYEKYSFRKKATEAWNEIQRVSIYCNICVALLCI